MKTKELLKEYRVKEEGQEVVDETTLTPPSDEEVLELLQDPVNSASLNFENYKDKYERFERLYEQKVAKGSDAQKLPVTESFGMGFQVVETAFPRLATSHIRPDVSAREGGDNQHSKLLEDTLNYFIETQHLDRTLKDWIKQGAKTVGACKVDFELKEYKVKRRKHKFEMNIPIVNKKIGVGAMEEVKEVKTEFRNILELIDWADLVIPEAKSNRNLPFIGFYTGQTIKAMEKDGRYKNLDTIKAQLAEDIKKNQSELERDSSQDLTDSQVDAMVLEKQVPYLEIYYEYEDENYLACISCDPSETSVKLITVIRSEALDRWHNRFPIVPLSMVTVENRAIGKSLIEVAENMVNQTDIWLSIILSVGIFDIMKPVVFDPTKVKGIDWQTNPPVFAPGMYYPIVGAGSSFTVLETPKVEGSHFEIFGLLKQTGQNITGITDYISGSEAIGEDKTLGEVQLKTAQSNKRFEPQLANIRDGLSDIFFIMASNIQQFLPDEYPIRLFGDRGNEWKKIRAEAVQGQMDYTVRGFENIFVDDQEKINKYISMVKFGQAFPQFVNLPELIKRTYEDGFNAQDVEKIIIPPQEQLQAKDEEDKQALQEADQENKNPLRSVFQPDQNHKVHLQAHTAFLQSEAGQQLPREQALALAKNIDAHRRAMQGQQEQQASQPQGQQPQQPSPQQMIRPSERKVKY